MLYLKKFYKKNREEIQIELNFGGSNFFTLLDKKKHKCWENFFNISCQASIFHKDIKMGLINIQ